jgi:hypothetical protein
LSQNDNGEKTTFGTQREIWKDPISYKTINKARGSQSQAQSLREHIAKIGGIILQEMGLLLNKIKDLTGANRLTGTET